MKNKKLLIVGGVAGGASCAARARRISEEAQIIVFERGPYVSFANCGLPYYVGNVITDEDDLLVATEELFRERFNIEVRTRHNVRSIIPEKKAIQVEDLTTGEIYTENYDALVLSPGSAPLRPDLPGIDLPGIFTLWTIPDTREIIAWVKGRGVRRAAVVGGGFIGLEMAENLKKIGVQVTVIEMQNHVMPALDPEMGNYVNRYLKSKEVELCLGSPVSGFKQNSDGTLTTTLQSGDKVVVDMVLLSVGVRPRIALAEAAGLKIGEHGGILVDERMRTSNDRIWAVGDAVEVKDYITGLSTMVPLAGPANRQGRLAADVILGDGQSNPKFRGVQATSVCGVLGMTIASTGMSEKQINRLSGKGITIPYEKIYLHPVHHAGYYPDAKTISMKLLFRKDNGKILGAQAVGMEGVEKRIDVISMAIQKEGTVFDLEEAELCYAPQYGSAKDPVNLAGMIAANFLRGFTEVAHWENLKETSPLILDVRDPDEFSKGHIKNAVNIPLPTIRKRMHELPKDQEIWAHCMVGQRSYYATRILSQNGFNAKNLTGGYLTYLSVKPIKDLP